MVRFVLVAVAASIGWVNVRAADDPKPAAQVATEARDLLRAACGRCHNGAGSSSLTWSNNIVPLVEVPGTFGTLLAVDIEELQWDMKERWRLILKSHPYGLGYEDLPELRELERKIASISDRALPVVRADWFVTTATRPPLYYQILDIPENAKTLEKQLDIDIAENFKMNKLQRAGFQESGVSAQNRLLERHEIKGGGGRAYWKSYDFLPGAANGRLALAPLGPLSLFDDIKKTDPKFKNPYERVAFVHDGGEIIFHLPNGLQAYMLVNGKDERIDEGPISVVHDNNRTSGTPAIVNGVSCMACHSQGMIPFSDTIRGKAAVYGDLEQKVLDLYPEASTMSKWVDKDNKRFQTALDETIGPWLRIDADKDLKLEAFREPVQIVASQHRLRRVTLEMAAWELDIEKPEDLLRKVGEETFRKLGLEALRKGKAIPRLEWESGRGRSLMQQLAASIGFGAK